MPEDEIAHQELAALTRRYEQHTEQTSDALKVLKSDVLHLRLEVGALTTRLDTLEGSVSGLRGAVDGLGHQMEANQARIIELLSGLVGRNPE